MNILQCAERHIRAACTGVIILSAWASFFLLIWYSDRGFDMTDEGKLLYLYRNPDSDLDSMYTQYFRIIHALLPSALDHIYYYRLIKLGAFVFGTGLFAAVFAKWLSSRFSAIAEYSLTPVALFHYLLVGSFLAYCHGSQSLSYNDIVEVLLLAAATACFALDLTPSCVNAGIWKFFISALVGALAVLLFFSKWPSAVLFSAYFVTYCTLITSDRRYHVLIAAFSGVVFGSALVVFLATDIGLGSLFSFSHLFNALRDPETLGDHGNVSTMLQMYTATTLEKIIYVLKYPTVTAAVTLPVAAMVVRALWNTDAKSRLFAGAALIAGVIFVARSPNWAWNHLHWFNRYRVADLQTFALLVAWIGAGYCLFFLMRGIMSRRERVALFGAATLLAILPAIGAVGTANALMTQFIRHAAPLFAALVVATAILALAGRWRPFAPVMCAAVAILSSVQLFFVVLLYPYRLPQAGFSQTIELNVPPHMAGLKVDVLTHAFIEKLVGIL